MNPPPAIPARNADTLQGDRCCAGCGFNLFGQTITREPHYGLLIVRCPECGHTAALQEYPSLSRMTWRIRLVMAAFWLAAILAGFVATGGIMYGWCVGTAESVLAPYVRYINGEWGSFQNSQLSAGPQVPAYYSYRQTEAWTNGFSPGQLFHSFGGWSALNWYGLLMWTFAVMTLVPIGIVWSVAFARLRGRRLLVVLLLPIGFAAALLADDTLDVHRSWSFDFDQFANHDVGLPLNIASLLFGTLCLFAGALFGRPLARLFLQHVLPARLLSAFSFLWSTDAKPMPRPPRR